MSKENQILKDDFFSTENIKNTILPFYNLQNSDISMVKFKDTDKQRAVYKIQHNNNNFCLKKIYFSETELLYVYSALEWLWRNGLNVTRLLPTASGGRYVNYNNILFILTPWIDGEKCSFDNREHLSKSIEELAKFHKKTYNFRPIIENPNRQSFQDHYISTKKHFEQLLEISNESFSHKDKFSKFFSDNLDNNLALAKISLEVASKINKDELKRSLCHGDYVNKNIIFDNDNKLWIIDFDKCKMDYSAHDISYFLRRLLKRENTNWDFNLTLSLLKIYNKTSNLSKSDLQYIVSYITFPQKYWKISKDYYKNIRKCNKNAFLTLLTKANNKIYNQLEFSYSLVNFMEYRNWTLPD